MKSLRFVLLLLAALMLTLSLSACGDDKPGDSDGDGVNNKDDNCVDVPNEDQANADSDDFGDACDNCPNTANDDQANSDADSVGDACDNCPNTDNANQANSDGDSFGDACDNCPNDDNPDQADLDSDGEGDACDPDIDGDGIPQGTGGNPCQGGETADCDDNCPTDPNADQADEDFDGVGDVCDDVNDPDADGDGVPNETDNCINTPNPDQADADSDGHGDACDNCVDLPNPDQANSDTDEFGDACDNCPDNPNPSQADADSDGLGNACDNCPDKPNPDQTDTDGDGEGDACEPDLDDDNDTIPNHEDNCPQTPNPDQADADSDGVGDVCDNCPGVANADQTDTDGDGQGDACEVVLTLNDFFPSAGYRGTDVEFTLTGVGIEADVALVFTNSDDSGITFTPTSLDVTVDNTVKGIIPTDLTRPLGLYHVTATNQSTGATDTLENAFQVSPNPPPTVTDVVPPFAFNGDPQDGRLSDRSITIQGTNFLSTPGVRWQFIQDPSQIFEARTVSFTDSTQLTAIVPSESAKMPPGDYKVQVINPDLQGAEWQTFEIVATPPPKITSIDPIRAAGNDFSSGTIPLTVTGENFVPDPDGSVIYLVGPAGDIPLNTAANSEIELVGVPGAAAVNNGAYPVKVVNPDGQWDVYYLFSLTSSAEGKLEDNWASHPESALNTGRWRHGATWGFDVFKNGYIYVAGGSDQSGLALDSVEYAGVSLFGVPGVWNIAKQFDPNTGTHVPNVLNFARTGVAVAHVGPYIYAVGGSADGLIAQTTTEMAKILSMAEIPYLNRHPKADPAGSLPLGSWYYKVSAVMPDGESLASHEAIARDAEGAITIRWAKVDGATSYNIYRTVSSDGRSQEERLLFVGAMGPEFTDDGTGALAPAPGNLRGTGTDGGTLSEGAWTYRVSAVTAAGETLAGYPLKTEVALGENSIVLNFDEVPDATGYKVYRTDAADSADETAYFLADITDGTTTTYTDTGGLSVDTGLPAPDGIKPLPPGSLTRWKVLDDGAGNPIELNTEREGHEAVIVSVSFDEDGDPVGTPDDIKHKTFLYAGGGRVDNSAGFYLNTLERTEIDMLTGGIGPWTLEPETFTVERAFYALLSSQGRTENPVPPDDPPPPCADVDGDGYEDMECGGTDCDDSDPTIHPGAPEICGDGIDQDCNGEDEPCGTCEDLDGDGYEAEHCGGTDCCDSGDESVQGCTPETAPDIHPGAEDICEDGIDQDCNGVDPDCDCTTDLDGDGYVSQEDCGDVDCCDSGNESDVPGCTPDTAADIHPGAEDICDDGIDQDCDGQDAPCCDRDNDGYEGGQCGGTDCCDDGSETDVPGCTPETAPDIHPGAEEICEDGIDQNCDGIDPDCGCWDNDGDGYEDEECGGDDCDDSDPTIHPGAYDPCGDWIDQNCDGWDPPCRRGPAEKVLLVATKGDNEWATGNRNGLGSSEVCTVNDDVLLGPIGQLSVWVDQPNADTQDFWGHEGLLYFNFVFNFAGTSDDRGSYPRGTSQVERFPFTHGEFDPDTGVPTNQVLGGYQSSAKTLVEQRAYFSLTRIFSALIAVGGIDDNGVVDFAESTRQ